MGTHHGGAKPQGRYAAAALLIEELQGDLAGSYVALVERKLLLRVAAGCSVSAGARRTAAERCVLRGEPAGTRLVSATAGAARWAARPL
jgi:hypothetical protein